MFKTTKKIKELAAETFAEIVAKGGINTEMVKMTKGNFNNVREYFIDNNKEISDFKECFGLILCKLEALEKYLDIEFNNPVAEDICEGCGDTIEGIDASYTKVKKAKKGIKE